MLLFLDDENVKLTLSLIAGDISYKVTALLMQFCHPFACLL